MKKILIALAALSASLLMLAAGTASAATLAVPGTYPTIQAAVNAAASGDTITVAAGTYDAFSVVGKTNLTIEGAGAGSTIIHPTTLITTGVGHKYTPNMSASVFVNTSTGITLEDMTVEDNGQAPGSGGPDALVFWNGSTGNITSMDVTGTYAINGDQTGQGIAVDAGSGQTTNLIVASTAISGFQKNGYDIEDGNGATSGSTGNITVDIEGGSIVGAGATTAIAQNGVVSWNEGGGTVNTKVHGTAISNLDYTGTPADTAAGLLAYGGATLSPVSDVSFTNTQLYIDSEGAPIDATSGNTFDGVSAASATGAQLATIENKMYDIMEAASAAPAYILPSTLIVTTTNLGIQAGLNVALTGNTVLVTPGTYSGDPTPPADNNVTLAGIGGPILNLSSGYGVNLDNNVAVTNFTFSGFTVNASPSTTYAFKAYKANGLTLTNDTFNGGSGNTGGGVDINTTSNVTFNNVTSNGFHKNGFADTSAYTAADSAASGNNITFNGITASNDGWTGISFYTVGGSGGSASINGVKFMGTNTVSNDGAGIFIEGDSDANYGTVATPANTITTNGTTLDLDDSIAFSGNSADDIINYQTAPATALTATFGGLTGNQMTGAQRTTEDGMIIDKLDHSNLGLVTYYIAAPFVVTNPATGVTASDVTLNGTNGPDAAGGHSFWVSTSTFATSSPNIPAGVYSTPDMGAIAASTTFSAALSSLNSDAVTTGGATGNNLPPITPNTTYYYVAWSNVGGTWYPGAELSFTTGSAPLVTVTIDKFIDGHMATAASADSMAFPMASSWVTTNIASGSGTYSLAPTGFNSNNPYEAVTAQMNNGASYTTNEVTTGNTVVGASCAANEPYALVGYSWGTSLANAEAMTPSLTAPNLTNMTHNEYVIVWNKACLASPTLLTPPNGTATTTAGLTGTSWSAVTDPAGGITYVYQSSNSSAQNPDGSFTTPAFTSGPLTATNEPTPNTPAGNYWWHVQAKDADGNVSPWSTVWTFTVQNGPSAPPANACSTPNTAPAGYTIKKGTAGNPTVTLSPFTMYVGMAGNPKITGAAGDYIVCLSNGNATVNLGDGSDTIATGNGNETITVGSGGSGSSTITTGNGNSTIKSTDTGNQTVTTGNGNNRITTGSGNDTISAGNGNQTINAGAGTDSCSVGAGKSKLTSCNP